jgi:hypothetical protein
MPMLGRSTSHYRILQKIGAGGVVYKAEDAKLGRLVARLSLRCRPGSWRTLL